MQKKVQHSQDLVEKLSVVGITLEEEFSKSAGKEILDKS